MGSMDGKYHSTHNIIIKMIIKNIIIKDFVQPIMLAQTVCTKSCKIVQTSSLPQCIVKCVDTSSVRVRAGSVAIYHCMYLYGSVVSVLVNECRHVCCVCMRACVRVFLQMTALLHVHMTDLFGKSTIFIYSTIEI